MCTFSSLRWERENKRKLRNQVFSSHRWSTWLPRVLLGPDQVSQIHIKQRSWRSANPGSWKGENTRMLKSSCLPSAVCQSSAFCLLCSMISMFCLSLMLLSRCAVFYISDLALLLESSQARSSGFLASLQQKCMYSKTAVQPSVPLHTSSCSVLVGVCHSEFCCCLWLSLGGRLSMLIHFLLRLKYGKSCWGLGGRNRWVSEFEPSVVYRVKV